MKTTKIFISVLLGFMVLAMGSCNTTEYRPTDGNCSFVIKKIDGKRQWGIVSPVGKTEYIPCQYDSIYSLYRKADDIFDLFVGIKSGKKYLLSTWHERELLEGRNFTSLVFDSPKCKHNSSIFGEAIFYEAQTNEGIIFFHWTGHRWEEFGPAEALFWTKNNILYKQNGKWGIQEGKWPNVTLPPMSSEVSCIYDEIISVKESYFWVKKDNKWSAIDSNGMPIRKSTALLNKYLRMPAMSGEQYQKEENSATFRKISLEEASYISVNPWRSDYISW